MITLNNTSFEVTHLNGLVIADKINAVIEGFNNGVTTVRICG